MSPEYVKLRGHHLLCILTYIGKGYTPDFIANFDEVIKKINQGAEIEITAGIDDICAALRHGAEITCSHARECRAAGVSSRDRMALREISRILQIPLLKAGEILVLKKGEIAEMRRKFQHNIIRHACTACSWHDLCSDIARGGYKNVRLLPKAAPRPIP